MRPTGLSTGFLPCFRSQSSPAEQTGTEKEDGSNQALTVFGYLIDPAKSGRLPEFGMTLAALLPLTPMLSGAPDCMETIPDRDQPPTAVFISRLPLVLRNGMS